MIVLGYSLLMTQKEDGDAIILVLNQILFLLLMYFRKKSYLSKPGTISGLFLIFYSIFRFFIEFYREPDEQIGYLVLNLSIGQGEILTTPLQIINLTNIISNEGFSFNPKLNKNSDTFKKTTGYNPKIFKQIKKAMSNAVYELGGTAYNTRIPKKNAHVYGKTGTVQLCTNCDIEPHAWFSGIIELKNDKTYTICVMIENGGKGSNISTKLAKKIFDFIIENDI